MLPKTANRPELTGIPEPRIAPPYPARSMLKQFKAAAKELGITLMHWQEIAAHYMTALGPDDDWLYDEFAAVVSRQNGKTEIIKPRVKLGLKLGRRMIHTAQNRAIPRETFLSIAAKLDGKPGIGRIRYANGQEVIPAENGGRYTLVAPRPGIRGGSADDIMLDEARQQETFEIVGALTPTITASRNPQALYLSNAGHAESVVLNDLKRRANTSPRLCYLEWSADPDLAPDDPRGWAQANPALGVTIRESTLRSFYESKPRSVFETEHLCRWVTTMEPRLVAPEAWENGHRNDLEEPTLPAMAVNMDPSGTRASAVIAWQQTDGTIACRVVADVTGDPIDVDRLGTDLKTLALQLGAFEVGYAPWTDAELAKYFKRPRPIDAKPFANASASFVQVVDSGRIRWDIGEAISDDLTWTSRKAHDSGAWTAVKSTEDRPVTAALAAIRAIWMASGPKPEGLKLY